LIPDVFLYVSVNVVGYTNIYLVMYY